MKIAATLIERIGHSSITADGRHMVVNLLDVEAEQMTLGIPIKQVPRLIGVSALALRDSERILRCEGDRHEPLAVGWWNLRREDEGTGFVMSFTLEGGGTLDFALPTAMALAMRDTLDVHLDPSVNHQQILGSAGEGARVGFLPDG